jgi:hypothetical protein
VPYRKLKYLPTVRSIPDDFWDEIEILLSWEKPNNTIGRLLFHLEMFWIEFYIYWGQGCRWKMLPKEHCSDSSCHRGWSKKYGRVNLAASTSSNH